MTLRSPHRLTPTRLGLALLASGLLLTGCLADSGRFETPTDQTPTDLPTDRTPNATPSRAETPMRPSVRPNVIPLVCAEADVPTDGVLVLSAHDRLELIRGDGRVDALTCAYEQLPEGVTPRQPQLITADQVVVTSVGWGGWQEAGGVVVSALGTELELLWQHAWPDHNATINAVSDDGSAVVTRHHRNTYAYTTYFVAADGTLTEIPEAIRVVNGHRIGALIPAYKDEVLGWLEPASGAFTPVTHRPAGLHFVEKRMFALVNDTDGAGSSLLFSDGVTTKRTPIGGVESQNLWINSVAGDYVLLNDRETGSLVRVNAVTSTVETIPFAAPDGMWTMVSCVGQSFGINKAGGLHAIFRDATVAQAHLYDDATGSWTAVGYPMTGIDGAEVSIVGKTLMVTAYPPFATYCPTEAWEETTAANVQVGASTQLSYDGGAPIIVPAQNASVSLSPNGQCMLLNSWTDVAVSELIDLTNGRKTGLTGGSIGTWVK